MDIREASGICANCQRNEHELCPMVMGGVQGGMAFCSCQCADDPLKARSLGSPEGFPRVPKKVRKEFRKLPPPENDPLDHIF